MAKKERGIFERPPGSGIWWARYADQYGKIHREKAGYRSLARALYQKRKTEVREIKALSTIPRFIPSALLTSPDIESRFHHNVTRGNIGTAGELIVCVDLIVHGFIVFRAVTVHAFCDLIAEKNGRLFRIEVKVSSKLDQRMKGRLNEGVDVMAWVSDKGITYVNPKTFEPIEDWGKEQSYKEGESWESSKKTVTGG